MQLAANLRDEGGVGGPAQPLCRGGGMEAAPLDVERFFPPSAAGAAGGRGTGKTCILWSA
eukprot:5314791-Pyramimonas_sp.AAC.1